MCNLFTQEVDHASPSSPQLRALWEPFVWLRRSVFRLNPLIGGAFVLIAVIAVGAVVANVALAPQQKAGAHEQLLATCTELYPGETCRGSCQSIDTDSNGYVSCTLVHDGKTEAMECPTLVSGLWNHGCRIMKPMVNVWGHSYGGNP